MKAAPIQNSFSSGELSPLVFGRTDSDRYKTGLETCENYLPTHQGGLLRRSGTYYVSEVKTSSLKTRLQAFEFSTTQAYILEFGDTYIRFYKDYAQITSGGPAYEISTPYLTADLFQLKFTQSADVLYITHPSYAPRKLTRSSHTSWTLTTITFVNGPYLPMNFYTGSTEYNTITIYPGATTGATTLTASSALFASTDVGRIVSLNNGGGAIWGYATITGFTSTTVVNATVVNAFGGAGAPNATLEWRMGLWSDTTGYPACSCFHEDRLFFGGTTTSPQRIDGSSSGDYEDFTPYNSTGTVADSDAVSFVLNSNDVNVVRNINTDEKGLIVETVGGEWIVRPSSQSEAITPTNISAKKSTYYGSANVQSVQAGKATLMLQRAGRKIRELAYFYEMDGFRSEDMTILAEHVTYSGVTQMAIQKEPQQTLWAVRTDGQLIGMTYERGLDSLKVGWHRHLLGGDSDAAGTDSIVESIAVIPSPDGTRDDLWLIVKRYINGSTKRYIEYMTENFTEDLTQKEAFFVDCGLTYDSPKTITGATQANPCVVTSASHGFSNGDLVLISDINGMDELEEETFTVANVTANTFELSGINSTSYVAYVSGGYARKYVTTVSGLSHLEGQSVSVLGDGAKQPNQTVSAGAITLSTRATTVQVGLGFRSRAKLLRIDAGSQNGTSIGKTRRTHRCGIMLRRTLGMSIGTDFDNLDEITFRTTSDPLTRAPSLFTGILHTTIQSNYDFESQVCIEQDGPLPGLILAVMPEMVTQER